MMEQDHFKHLHENDTYIRPEDFPVVDDLLDWLIDKQRQGWKMVDSVPRLQNMKGFMRGVGGHWGCRAGQNRSEEHTSELQSRLHLVCRLLLEKKKTTS